MWIERLSRQSHQRGELDHRNPYERDLTRVIHCPAFRRLQRKTQILGTDEGDFHRTRLTHSLEVSSIGRSIIRNLSTNREQNGAESLLPSDDLIAVICLLHDIGHPPFGHGGEVALNFMMREHGGFEGNAQTLRLLTKIEDCYGKYGLDLTRRALLGILKYPAPRSRVCAPAKPFLPENIFRSIRINDWLPPKAFYDSESAIVEWVLAPFTGGDAERFMSLRCEPNGLQHGKTAYHSLDCSIMDTADDIAYGVHDLEDAIHLRLIQRDALATEAFKEVISQIPSLPNFDAMIGGLFASDVAKRKDIIGKLVNYFITATELVQQNRDFEHAILSHQAVLKPEAQRLLEYFKECIYEKVIDSQEARTFEHGGQMVVLRLFEAIESNPQSLLDEKNRRLWLAAADDADAHRLICDYIANMTDEYAYRMHERLFGFNTRTIFERL